MHKEHVDATIFKTFKGVNGRGHFYTIFISFKRRALYEEIKKYSNSKSKIIRNFLH